MKFSAPLIAVLATTASAGSVHQNKQHEAERNSTAPAATTVNAYEAYFPAATNFVAYGNQYNVIANTWVTIYCQSGCPYPAGPSVRPAKPTVGPIKTGTATAPMGTGYPGHGSYPAGPYSNGTATTAGCPGAGCPKAGCPGAGCPQAGCTGASCPTYAPGNGNGASPAGPKSTPASGVPGYTGPMSSDAMKVGSSVSAFAVAVAATFFL